MVLSQNCDLKSYRIPTSLRILFPQDFRNNRVSKKSTASMIVVGKESNSLIKLRINLILFSAFLTLIFMPSVMLRVL